MENIIITDQERLEQIKAEMKKSGASGLRVLAGFDRTLTKTIINGQKVRSLMSILRESDIMPKEYSQKAQELFAYYHPKESDPLITREERKKLMEEWWNKMFGVMVEFGFSKSHLHKIINLGLTKFRDGYLEFFEILRKNDIPLNIVSASGVGEAIELLFKKEKISLENICIFSNSFDWDDEGLAVRPEMPIIHSLNKDEVELKLETRKNIILLGDNPEDIALIKNLEYENIIKIGFLNEKEEENLGVYKNNFDIIITQDGGFEFIKKLVEDICSKQIV